MGLMKQLVLFMVAALALSAAADVTDRHGPQVLNEEGYGERLTGWGEEVGLWWTYSGWKINRTRPLPRPLGRRVKLSAARNEWDAVQVVVRPKRDMTGFIAEAGDLTGPDGASIAASNIEVLRERYVYVRQPTDRMDAIGWWPDPLPPFKGPINLEAHKNQPLWVRVYVPKGTPAGAYNGTISLHADGYAAEVPLRVAVYDFELPDRMTCTSAFGFNPGTVYSYQKVSDGDQRREVLEKYWESFRTHRITPYNPAPHDPIKVDWVKRTAEEVKDLSEEDQKLLTEHAITPVFDWTAWDAEMERTFAKFHFNSFRLSFPGIGGQICGFNPGTRGHELAFGAYCREFQEHLREKGWLDEAYIYWYDEPEPKHYEHVLNGFLRLKEAAPDIARMLTEQVEPELVGGPNLWCPMPWTYDHARAEERREEGDHFWWYVCTIPKKPYAGLFIDHPGTDFRCWLWQTWMYGIEGILIWHSNLWTTGMAYPHQPQNPYEDTMSWMTGYGTKVGEKRPWGNGDGRFMYPPEAAATARQEETILDGPVDSIRWEMLRDGLEDYEYLVILERLIEEKGSSLSADERAAYSKLLGVPPEITTDPKNYTFDPEPIEKQRERIARAIEELEAK